MARFGILCACALLFVHHVAGQGYMTCPPQRSSMWRYGYDTPINYSDKQVNCGGFGTQWNTNDGKCGVCGDDYSLPRPRPNENGGTYGTGQITNQYTVGETIEVTINMTGAHMGYYEFRLCPVNSPDVLETEDCFNENLLELGDGTTRYQCPESPGVYNIEVKLPEGLTCTQCVLQWFWRTGNNWGDCDDGTSALGCGPQETWVNCADIAIE